VLNQMLQEIIGLNNLKRNNMKNIQGTEVNLDLFNENGIKVYEYFKHPFGHSEEFAYDSNGNIINYKNSSGYSYEATFDSNNNELTYKKSNGKTIGFDKTYTTEEAEFIKRAVQQYWEIWTSEHPDNQKDFKLTKQILSK